MNEEKDFFKTCFNTVAKLEVKNESQAIAKEVCILDMRTDENIKYKNQQKEFINYLEDEIKRINPKELDIGELNLRLDDIKFTQYLIYKENLQKYKEITGVSDENNKQ